MPQNNGLKLTNARRRQAASERSQLNPVLDGREIIERRVVVTTVLTTNYKERLPKGWSYPIGAQELSAFLHLVPGAKEQPLSFSPRAGWFHSRLDALRREDHPYEILHVRFGRERHFGQDPLAATWDVHVYAVPSGLRASVRQSLIPAGMTRVAAWLSRARPDTSLEGGASCVLLTRDSDAALYIEERNNRFEDAIRDEIATPSNNALQLTRSARPHSGRGPRS